MKKRVFVIGGAALEITGIPKSICRLRDSNPGTVRLAVGGVAACVFVGFNLIHPSALVPPVEVEVFADIVECLLHGIRAYAEVGVWKTLPDSIDIVFYLHSETLLHITHHIVKRTGVCAGIVVLRPSRRVREHQHRDACLSHYYI